MRIEYYGITMLRSLKARQVKNLMKNLSLEQQALRSWIPVHQLIGFGGNHERVINHEVAALDTKLIAILLGLLLRGRVQLLIDVSDNNRQFYRMITAEDHSCLRRDDTHRCRGRQGFHRRGQSKKCLSM
jgi:hypothetical protein